MLALGTNDLSEVVPLLADLLSIPTGARYPPLALSPHKRKEKTLQAQIAQVEGLAARQPVLVVFEDVHWSDPTTRESLDLLVDRVAALRVLAIITFRPEFSPPWIGRSHVSLLSLNRLPPRRRSEMIAHVAGGKTLPKVIADQIIERTDGVPLFIEELTKAVIESGIPSESRNGASTARMASLAIPTTLQASLLARLDRLSATREVAQVAAALGRQFSHELISAAAQMPQAQLENALAQLVGAELIFRRGSPPEAEYAFKHALVQDAAYSTLLRSQRHLIHGRIAAALEGQFPEIAASQPEKLAHHCAESGQPEKAVGYFLAASQQAFARSAMEEAVAHTRKGIAFVSGLPDSASRRQQECARSWADGRKSISCGRGCLRCPATSPPPRTGCRSRSPSRARWRPGFSNCWPPWSLRDCGTSEESGWKPLNSSPRSTVGSAKGSKRRSSGRPRRCWSKWRSPGCRIPATKIPFRQRRRDPGDGDVCL